MATFLFDKIIFGPVKSRRLGNSLGINILFNNAKYCNYNCVYCECGWSGEHEELFFPTASQVSVELEKYLKSLSSDSIKPDVITFAGNGEPTLNPEFFEIINKTVELRNFYLPDVKIAVLTNATQLNNPEVVEGLNKIDMPILKIDTVDQKEFELINGPVNNITIEKIIDMIILKIRKPIIQTMFLKASFDDYYFDNTTKRSLEKYYEVLKKISPEMVMIYSIARDTPMEGLESINLHKMQEIGEEIEKMGFKTIVTP
ncbi:MAG: radical SAM protein [Bacteroidales bacterium]|jgi:wyosine [tRNA(Phe)-imidazoG37] synthetase (radical SAM superfamily)|nr:radical SAM protein [Bacteroidales bacterium]